MMWRGWPLISTSIVSVADAVGDRLVRIELVSLLVEVGDLHPRTARNRARVGFELAHQQLEQRCLARSHWDRRGRFDRRAGCAACSRARPESDRRTWTRAPPQRRGAPRRWSHRRSAARFPRTRVQRPARRAAPGALGHDPRSACDGPSRPAAATPPPSRVSCRAAPALARPPRQPPPSFPDSWCTTLATRSASRDRDR